MSNLDESVSRLRKAAPLTPQGTLVPISAAVSELDRPRVLPTDVKQAQRIAELEASERELQAECVRLQAWD